MTDERMDAEILLRAANALKKGQGGIIFRHYRTDLIARRRLFEKLQRISRRRRLTLLVAGGASKGSFWKADGRHGKPVSPAKDSKIQSMAAHNLRDIIYANRMRVDLIFLSPLFLTRSHPGQGALGRVKFAQLASKARLPVFALGGVKRKHASALKSIGAEGWAAIDGLTV